MSDTPIYQALADERGFDPLKMQGIVSKSTSFDGPKRRGKRGTSKTV